VPTKKRKVKRFKSYSPNKKTNTETGVTESATIYYIAYTPPHCGNNKLTSRPEVLASCSATRDVISDCFSTESTHISHRHTAYRVCHRLVQFSDLSGSSEVARWSVGRSVVGGVWVCEWDGYRLANHAHRGVHALLRPTHPDVGGSPRHLGL